MNIVITPNHLKGDVVIPPSKSLSHRAIIAASLAEGDSVISNVLLSNDIIATINGMRACGARIDIDGDKLYIKGSRVIRKENIIDANESGSTIRFMIPIALVSSEPITFIGKNNLVNRPLDPYLDIFDRDGISYKKEEKYLPLFVSGGLKPGTYPIRGDISSQFITGLLFALPMLDGDSVIEITTNLESKGYIDLTLDILSKFGIEIVNDNYQRFYINGNQKFKPYDYEIEGDFSQSAFFLVADMLGADINLKAMNLDSHQGDKKILKDIKDFGGKIINDGRTINIDRVSLHSTTIDFSQSPDLGPALTVLASVTPGVSNFTNASRLRIKECDRITCMKEELEKMGAQIEELSDGMIITGVNILHGATLDSHNDHRVAMALAMASLACDGEITILNCECVSKSFPHFWNVFEALGGKIRYE